MTSHAHRFWSKVLQPVDRHLISGMLVVIGAGLMFAGWRCLHLKEERAPVYLVATSRADHPINPQTVCNDSRELAQATPYELVSRFLACYLGLQKWTVVPELSIGAANALARLDDARSPTRSIEAPDVTRSLFDRLVRLGLSAIEADDGQSNRRNVLTVVQADVLHHYIHGNHPQFVVAHSASRVRFIETLFAEQLQWSVGVCSAPETWDDLRHHQRVCTKGLGSGSLVTVSNLQRVSAPRWNFIEACDISEPEADVLTFKVESSYSDGWQSKLDAEVAEALTEAFPNVYRSRRIKGGSPAGRPLAELDVDAMLVAARELQPELAITVREALEALECTVCEKRQQRSECRDKSPMALTKDIAAAIRDRTSFCTGTEGDDAAWRARRFENAPIARQSGSVLPELDPITRFLVSIPRRLVFGIVFGGLGLLAITYGVLRRRSTLRAMESGVLRAVIGRRRQLFLFVLFHFLAAVLIWFSEYHSNALWMRPFVGDGLRGALSWVLSYVTLGSEAVDFQSVGANVMVGALKLVWTYAAAVFSFLIVKHVYYVVRVRMRDHVVILGWHAGADELLVDLEDQDMDWVVAAPSDPTHKDFKIGANYHKVSNLNEAFEQTSLRQARSAIVLSDSAWAGSKDDAVLDMWVCQTLLAIRQHEVSSRKEPIPLLAEMQSPSSLPLAKRAGAPELPSRENPTVGVCARTFGMRLLAHESTKPGVVRAFESLIKTGDSAHELYPVSLGPEWTKKYSTFNELAQNASLIFDEPALIIGIVESDGVRFNPRDQTLTGEVKVMVISLNKPVVSTRIGPSAEVTPEAT